MEVLATTRVPVEVPLSSEPTVTLALVPPPPSDDDDASASPAVSPPARPETPLFGTWAASKPFPKPLAGVPTPPPLMFATHSRDKRRCRSLRLKEDVSCALVEPAGSPPSRRS